ncbi:MAG: hypothetical protein WC404_02690 [Candidatus Omnitrophota bacterium]|jgi:hypothetical protein
MSKKILLHATSFACGLLLVCNISFSSPMKFTYPIEISGKILDKDGKPFTDNVEIELSVSTEYLDFSKSESQMQSTEDKDYKINVQGGVFSWKGEGSHLSIEAVKEGYHSTLVDAFEEGADHSIKQNDILIYLVPSGVSSKLELTRGAEIPSKDNNKSGGKECGWSFSKRWYYPIDEEETAWLTESVDEEGNYVYTMKGPGGFVLFSGFPQFERKMDEHDADFELMTEAPEEGYVQSVTPAFDREKEKTHGDVYYYFKTPDGKYGKICFSGFDYYINPDGSRNLEAGEVEEWDPINPIEADRHKH